MGDRPYDIVTHAGPPSSPVAFENISYHRGKRVDTLVHNPNNGEHFTAQDVLFQNFPSSREAGDGKAALGQVPAHITTGYWTIPQKEQKRTIWGCVKFCYVLRRDAENTATAAFTLTFDIVALKMFDWANVRANQHMHESPVNEIAAMQFLGANHPNVVGCHEVLFDGKCLNAVLDYCNGGDLHDRLYQVNLKNGGTVRVGLQEEEARYWFQHLLEGLSYLQDNGICHRDLSPENVMLVQSEESGDKSLIIDMGMCLKIPYSANDGTDNITNSTNGSTRRLMTPQGSYGKRRYMAPELLRDDIFDGHSVDIWAAGTILFFMLTGCTYELPSNDDPLFRLLVRDVGGLIRRLIESGGICSTVRISADAIDLLQNIFREDPRLRYSMSEIMLHPWLHDSM
eukprot:CAMPEP_0198269960 /NCGR_PEP_ID=MMETSP1447-20131203/43279_1 /TAXON_ID=420782 /ORGANISM="Chaetoceros dichaeta, Strain CCMP1751" /LENGTH=397 /DNA_ID=CAMNT_0043961771 /DNA_START=89 /DNA_END=1282 /DNA_ORIENTATION=-